MSIWDLADSLLRQTEDGRVTDWVERIALIAKEIGLNLSQIDWGKAPAYVAHEVIDKARINGLIDKLADRLGVDKDTLR